MHSCNGWLITEYKRPFFIYRLTYPAFRWMGMLFSFFSGLQWGFISCITCLTGLKLFALMNFCRALRYSGSLPVLQVSNTRLLQMIVFRSAERGMESFRKSSSFFFLHPSMFQGFKMIVADDCINGWFNSEQTVCPYHNYRARFLPTLHFSIKSLKWNQCSACKSSDKIRWLIGQAGFSAGALLHIQYFFLFLCIVYLLAADVGCKYFIIVFTSSTADWPLPVPPQSHASDLAIYTNSDEFEQSCRVTGPVFEYASACSEKLSFME